MCKSPALLTQDRRFLCEMKEALAIPHRGPSAIPRKKTAADLGYTESWYSFVLDLDRTDMMNLVTLRKYVNVTGNLEPLRVLQNWLEAGHMVDASLTPEKMLSDSLHVDAAFSNCLARAMEDHIVTHDELLALIPLSASKIHQAQKNHDALLEMVGRS